MCLLILSAVITSCSLPRINTKSALSSATSCCIVCCMCCMCRMYSIVQHQTRFYILHSMRGIIKLSLYGRMRCAVNATGCQSLVLLYKCIQIYLHVITSCNTSAQTISVCSCTCSTTYSSTTNSNANISNSKCRAIIDTITYHAY
jgi:hypothetical protein